MFPRAVAPGLSILRRIIMKTSYLIMLLSAAVSIASALVTYTFVSFGNQAISLDDTQAIILMLALMQMMFLGNTGVMPLNINKVYRAFFGVRGRRGEELLYKVPLVEEFPCSRRLLCEVEAAARTSENYNSKYPEEVIGRNPEEEINPPEQDQITEVSIEAVKAFYREENLSGELTNVTQRALGLVQELTGKNCEAAYKSCPGRFTTELYFRAIFDEIGFEADPELVS